MCILPDIWRCAADNWETQDPMFPRTWIEAHEAASAAMGKPLVLEEVRMPSIRVHNAVAKSIFEARSAAHHVMSLICEIILFLWAAVRQGGGEERHLYSRL